MKVCIVVSSSCCEFDTPTTNCFVFSSKKKAKEFIAKEWKHAILVDYEDEYKEFKKTPKQEREMCCYYEFEKNKNGFEIYKNGYYNTDHFTLELFEKEIM